MANGFSNWKNNVPPRLIPAVTHIRNLFSEANWKINETTQVWCYALIHTLIGSDGSVDLEKVQDFSPALDYVKSTLSASEFKIFRGLIKRGTPSTILKAFSFVYETSMAAQVAASFYSLLNIGSAHAKLLLSQPTDWAVWHTKSMIHSAACNIPDWLRRCCDGDHLQPGDDLETLLWQKWQAPRFLLMRPFGVHPLDPLKALDREEFATSTAVVNKFKKQFILGLEGCLSNCEGKVHVDAAIGSTQRSPAGSPQARTVNPRLRPGASSRNISNIERRRRGAVFGALQVGVKGLMYCKALDQYRLPVPEGWRANGCPSTYLEAYRTGGRWRKYIQDQKSKLRQKYDAMTPAQRESFIDPTYSPTRRTR